MYYELVQKLKQMDKDNKRIELSLLGSDGNGPTYKGKHICKINDGTDGTFTGVTMVKYDILVDVFDTRYKQ